MSSTSLFGFGCAFVCILFATFLGFLSDRHQTKEQEE